jgi:predicted nucleic acid-binding protein
MAKSPIFDTSTIIEYSENVESLYHSALFPSIVFFELIATSIDESSFKKYSRWHSALKKADRMLTPTENDWWETSKTIRRMYLSKIAQESKLKTLRMDALIARLAVKNDGFIVTVDFDDFALIKKAVPPLQIISAAEFFGG